MAYLLPFMEQEKKEALERDPTLVHKARPKIILATVKGDVHDIGKVSRLDAFSWHTELIFFRVVLHVSIQKEYCRYCVGL